VSINTTLNLRKLVLNFLSCLLRESGRGSEEASKRARKQAGKQAEIKVWND
jgi:hypothetical protein